MADREHAAEHASDIAVDEGGALLAKALEAVGRPGSPRLPVILGVGPRGEIVFFSEGYRIGAGEQVLETLRRPERARR